MNQEKIPTSLKPRLKVIDGEITTTSLDVAEKFGKSHDNVLRDIRNLLASLDPEFASINFEEVKETMSYKDSAGEVVTKETSRTGHYRMTRDGFSLLVMGFTGKAAMKWKVTYLNAFRFMETRLVEVMRAVNKLEQSGVDKPLDFSDPNNMPALTPALFMRIQIALNHEMPATIVVWWALKHKAYLGPVRVSYRAIAEEFGGIARKSGLYWATKKWAALGILVHGAGGRGAPTTIQLQLGPLSDLLAKSGEEGHLDQLFSDQGLSALAVDLKQIAAH